MRTTSSVCGGSATGGVEGDKSSSEDEESGDVHEETRESEDSHSQQVAIPSVPVVLRAPQPSAFNRKRIRLNFDRQIMSGNLIGIISNFMGI